MHRPPHNVISGVFNKEFAADIIVYGIIMGAAHSSASSSSST
jgi:hypothetical protein